MPAGIKNIKKKKNPNPKAMEKNTLTASGPSTRSGKAVVANQKKYGTFSSPTPATTAREKASRPGYAETAASVAMMQKKNKLNKKKKSTGPAGTNSFILNI